VYPVNPGMASVNPYGSVASRLDFAEIFRRVYLWLALGLTIGFGVAFALGAYLNAALASGQSELVALIYSPVVVIGAVLAYLGIGIFFYPIVQRASPAVGGTLYVLFTAIFGLTTAAIFVVYTPASIAGTFFITATMFALMTLIGFTTQLDLSRMGSVLLMALIGIIVASVVNFFLHSAALYWIISLVGVVLFSALTAYDTQWVKRNAYQLASSYGAMEDEAVISRIALIGAFRLFLDFVNLFFSLLRLLGARR
jgi:uncharacterized protein